MPVPLNKIAVDAIISPKSEGERELAAFHFLKLCPQDLLLLDRGYPAHYLFRLALSMRASFCARIAYKRRRTGKKFYFSGKKEQIVNIQPSPSSIKKCFEMGLEKEPVKVRMLRIELDSGEKENLATSLTDMNKFSYDLFSELYHLR
ncbi:MAG: hypothetical protein JRE28_04295 [Deltaproteobacteria bacterium]|nr:hypothetical protein [Deltaproteobacteria bacterium]